MFWICEVCGLLFEDDMNAIADRNFYCERCWKVATDFEATPESEFWTNQPEREHRGER